MQLKAKSQVSTLWLKTLHKLARNEIHRQEKCNTILFRCFLLQADIIGVRVVDKLFKGDVAKVWDTACISIAYFFDQTPLLLFFFFRCSFLFEGGVWKPADIHDE